MKIIDSDNYAEHGIETMFFPGGEPHVKLPLFTTPPLMFAKLRTWNDVGFAALVFDALDTQRCGARAFIPYFPGARQDRSNGTAPLTLSVIRNMFEASAPLVVFDPHSNELIEQTGARYFGLEDLTIPLRDRVGGVIAPDKGAMGRASRFRDRFYPGVPLIECSKQRDSQTGRLSHYELPKLPRSGHFIVVDDICDGGGTFNLLADAFRKQVGYNTDRYSLELIVSHGIFSKGLDAISQMYSRITTTDSWCRLPPSERLTIIPLNQLFDRIMENSRA